MHVFFWQELTNNPPTQNWTSAIPAPRSASTDPAPAAAAYLTPCSLSLPIFPKTPFLLPIECITASINSIKFVHRDNAFHPLNTSQSTNTSINMTGRKFCIPIINLIAVVAMRVRGCVWSRLDGV